MKRYFLFPFRYDAQVPGAGAGGDTELIMKSIADLGKSQKEGIDAAKTELSQQVVDVTGQIKQVETKAENLAKVVGELEETQKLILKKQGQIRIEGGEARVKSFNEILAETIEENIEKIKSFRKGDDLKFRMKGFEDEAIKEVKAVGNMSTSANFVGNANYVTDFRTNIIDKPYNNIWLSDVIPNEFSAQGSSVMYPKENGGEGGAASWTDPTADKAQMDFDLTTQSAYFKWGAGYVIVAREMLDDIPFMTAYIQTRMLRSLKTWENSFILSGTADTNPVVGLATLATAYDGALTDRIGMIIDGAFGQIPEDTFNFYRGTTVVLQPRRAVEIGLNQASGSGEYNLPAGSVGFRNGMLELGGLTPVTTTQIGADDFYAFDRSALVFIRRMQPELRMFEDSILAKKNLVMFRIEERATLVCFNNAAVVKGTLPALV